MKRVGLLAARILLLGVLGSGCGITGVFDSAETYTAYATLHDAEKHTTAGEGTVKITVDGKAVTAGGAGFQAFTKSLTRPVELRQGQRISIEVVTQDAGIEPDCSVVAPGSLGRSKEASAAAPQPNPGGGLRTTCDWTRSD